VPIVIFYLSCGCTVWRGGDNAAPRRADVVNLLPGGFYSADCRRCGSPRPRVIGTEQRHIQPVPVEAAPAPPRQS
jgi:hypothetical protein